eukprot:scaffold1471_cov413-Prasinococcus_capsulatus_cf.AAC.31
MHRRSRQVWQVPVRVVVREALGGSWATFEARISSAGSDANLSLAVCPSRAKGPQGVASGVDIHVRSCAATCGKRGSMLANHNSPGAGRGHHEHSHEKFRLRQLKGRDRELCSRPETQSVGPLCLRYPVPLCLS